MKQIYFVRHGESEANVAKVRDSGASPLTKAGQEQSVFLAKRFASLPLDIILASPYVRTKQTAEIFNKELQKPIEYSEFFAEMRGPSETNGIAFNSTEGKEIYNTIRENFYKPDWRYSDEENFEDLKKRGLQALEFLLSRPEENIAVITHGGFLRILIALMMQGNALTPKEEDAMFHFLATVNTGITICRYDEKNVNKGWQLVTWMDHAHLGDAP